jgi:hypothetical protein
MQTLSIGSCADPHYAVCRVSDLKIQLDPSYPNRLSQGISLVRDASYIQVGVLDTQLAPSALMYTTMVPTDAHSDWIVPRRASREAGVSIHLYLVRLNHDSVPCAYLAGMGVVAIRQLLHQSTLGPIAIRDERSRMVATVSFSVTEPLPPIPIEGPMPCVVPKGVSAWKSPLKAKPAPRTRFPALAQLLCDTTRTFLYAETPKWILAHQIETPLNQTPPEFWVAAVHAACAIASIPLDAFVRDPTQHAEVLGQVCSLVGGQTPYLADGSAVGTSFLMSGMPAHSHPPSIVFVSKWLKEQVHKFRSRRGWGVGWGWGCFVSLVFDLLSDTQWSTNRIFTVFWMGEVFSDWKIFRFFGSFF